MEGRVYTPRTPAAQEPRSQAGAVVPRASGSPCRHLHPGCRRPELGHKCPQSAHPACGPVGSSPMDRTRGGLEQRGDREAPQMPAVRGGRGLGLVVTGAERVRPECENPGDPGSLPSSPCIYDEETEARQVSHAGGQDKHVGLQTHCAASRSPGPASVALSRVPAVLLGCICPAGSCCSHVWPLSPACPQPPSGMKVDSGVQGETVFPRSRCLSPLHRLCSVLFTPRRRLHVSRLSDL